MAQQFLQHLENELRYAKPTIIAYKNDIQQFEQFLQRENLIVSDVDKQVFRFYLQHLKQQQLSGRSIARKISAIKHYFRYLVENGIMSNNKIEDVSLPVQKKRLPKVLYNEELAHLLETEREEGFSGLRMQLILELLYGCGIRVSELVQISRKDIIRSEQLILVHGKGNKERYVPFGQHALNALDAYESSDTYQRTQPTFLLMNQQGSSLSTRGVHYLLDKEAKRIGMHIPIHPHLFRHTFATDMLNEGANLREVQEMLGHAHLSSTQIYTHVSTAKLQNAYLQSHPRAGRQMKNEEKE
ncbi:MAG: tyrosine-type recombinase/integrase [Culicoidibacterales bacterium]